MNDTLTDIFGNSDSFNSISNNNVEQESTMYDIFGTSQSNNETAFQVNEPNVISMEDLIQEEQRTPKTVVKKKDKILITQIVLIILWVVLTVVVYYFGYDFFEPFINV